MQRRTERRSSAEWRKGDCEDGTATVPFVQEVPLVPARAILLYEDIKSGAVQNWLQTPDGRPITIVAVDDAGSPFVVHLLNVPGAWGARVAPGSGTERASSDRRGLQTR